MKKKTLDCDSVAYQKNNLALILQGVDIPPRFEVPDHLIDFLKPIIDLRSYDTWNEVDLGKAVNLAACQYDIVRLRADIIKEGDVMHNNRGTPVANPKHAILEVLTRRELALSRALHIHAEALFGRSRDAGNKSKVQRENLTAIETARLNLAGLIPGV